MRGVSGDRLNPPDEAWASVYAADAAGVLRAIDEQKLPPSAHDTWGVTPLMAAALHSRIELMLRLFERGADPGAVDNHGHDLWAYLPLNVEYSRFVARFAAFDKNVREMAHAQRQQRGRDFWQIFRHDIEAAVSLILAGDPHPYLGWWQRPLLFVALEESMSDHVERLLAIGISANVRDAKGRSALEVLLTQRTWLSTYDPAKSAHLRDVLLEAGADTSGVLLATVRAGQEENALWSLDHLAIADAEVSHAFFVALQRGMTSLVKRMLEREPTLVTRPLLAHGVEPLVLAVDSLGGTELLELLIARGANVTTAFAQAVRKENRAAARLLLAHGATLDNALLQERALPETWPFDE